MKYLSRLAGFIVPAGLMLSSLLCADAEFDVKLRNHFFSPDVTELEVSDWYNPTVEDCRLIQEFIWAKTRKIVATPVSDRPFPNLCWNTEFYGWVTYRMNRAELVGYGEDVTTVPKRQVIYFNNDPSNKKKCVITYASYPVPEGSGRDRDYARSVQYIIESLKKHNFDGHLIYYLGGWPGLEKGRLKYVDVPYSFKPFLFEEVRDLGYENVLWLDASCVPVKNLMPIFDFIQERGLCFHGGYYDIRWNEFNQVYKVLMPFLDLNKPNKELISQVVGLNFNNAAASKLLERWIEEAEKKIPYLQSDEPPFVFLINDMNLLRGQLPYSYYVETQSETGNFDYQSKNPYAIIYHQYDFMNPKFTVPDDLFTR